MSKASFFKSPLVEKRRQSSNR
uniref:Uncharacterized protein n=1 Tax=Rhizophora mucronata TaxID=61149 RepID=A0A2P2N6Z0_RHIMU